jgi:hypothetical protein
MRHAAPHTTVAVALLLAVGSSFKHEEGDRQMAKTRLDESRWPLVLYTAIGDQSDEDFEAYLADADRVLARRERHGVIFDARRASPIGPKLRKRQVEWLRQNDRQLRAQCVALGMLLSSPIQRGVFRAIMWMNPLPYPYSVEVRFDAARLFVCQHLERSGCAAPPIPRWDQLLWSQGERPRSLGHR